jgi:hypothetical protein
MKKFIYTISFLAIVLTFSGSAVLAQSTTRIDADIPFAFTLGGETFEAGKYVMRVRRTSAGAEKLEVRDAKNRVVYEAFMLQNGDTTNAKPELVFDRVSGQAVLAKIRLENMGLDVPADKDANVTLASKERKRNGGSSN